MSVIITVGIIARNEEKNISKTLKTLLTQTFPGECYEVIVVDGNSSDNTREFAWKVLNKSNVNYKILNEEDFGFHGHCFARNLVIDNASKSSRYIAFTDADCILDEKWLTTLYNSIKNTDEHTAGAGGPRLIAETDNKKELVINSFLTTIIASGGNPAFSKRNVKFTNSIANYNAIYKKHIISKFRYDDKLIISDDNELNFRLRKAGYVFRNVPDARVWHHETDSILEFAENMYSYGKNITNTVKKHRNMVTVNIPLTMAFIVYLIILIPAYYLLGVLVLIPLALYIVFAFVVFFEVVMKTKTFYAIMIFVLVPIQHIAYGLGAFSNLLRT